MILVSFITDLMAYSSHLTACCLLNEPADWPAPRLAPPLGLPPTRAEICLPEYTASGQWAPSHQYSETPDALYWWWSEHVSIIKRLTLILGPDKHDSSQSFLASPTVIYEAPSTTVDNPYLLDQSIYHVPYHVPYNGHVFLHGDIQRG